MTDENGIIDLRSDDSEEEEAGPARRRIHRVGESQGKKKAIQVSPLQKRQGKKVKEPTRAAKRRVLSKKRGDDEDDESEEEESGVESEEDALSSSNDGDDEEEEEEWIPRRKKANKPLKEERRPVPRVVEGRKKRLVTPESDEEDDKDDAFDEIEVMDVSSQSSRKQAAPSSSSAAMRGGGGKTIGMKRRRAEGSSSSGKGGDVPPSSSSILSFVKKETGPAAVTSMARGGAAAKEESHHHHHELWTDKYRPKKASDLSLPPKKVGEVRKWLLDAATGGQGAPKILVLRGAPGVGKSTMLHVLAEELGFTITAWSESAFSSGGGGGGGAADDWGPWEGGESWRRGGRGGGGEYVSQAEDFKSFVRGAAYQPLEIAAKAPSPAKKGPSSSAVMNGKKQQKHHQHDAHHQQEEEKKRQLIVLEELPYQGTDQSVASFRAALLYFLTQSPHPGVIVLTDENEDKGTLDMEKRLPREVLQSPFVSQIRCNPATDANLRKILTRIASSERVSLPSDVLASILLSSSGDVRHAILTLQMQMGAYRRNRGGSTKRQGAPPPLLPPSSSGSGSGGSREKDVYYSSFHAIGKLLMAKRLEDSPPPPPLSAKTKTSSVPGFVGRAAAAAPPPPGSGDGRPPLAFVPETVIDRCDMEVDAIATFVQTHCVPLYGDLDDLTSALAFLSDADMFISRIYSTQFHRDLSDPVFPVSYAESLVGRTVAHTNLHAIKPSSMLHITSPRWYECMRARRQGMERLGHLCNDYTMDLLAASSSSSSYSWSSSSSSSEQVAATRLDSHSMVTDLIPFAKAIANSSSPPSASQRGVGDKHEEEEGVDSLASAMSFVRLFNRRCALGFHGSGNHHHTRQQDEAMGNEVSAQVLAGDDILEDDEEDW